MRSKATTFSIVMIALFLGISFIGCIFPIDIALNLLAGWGMFLWKTLPAVTVDWTSVITAIVALGVFAVGLHRFCRWFYGTRDDSSLTGRTWKFAWSSAMVWSIVLMFTAGIAMIGVTHQLVWLCTMKTPFLYNTFDEVYARRDSRDHLQQIGLAAHNYHDEYGTFPAGGMFDDAGRSMHSWATQLLPYLEDKKAAKIYGQIATDVPWNDPRNAAAFEQQLSWLLNPAIEMKEHVYDEPIHFDAEQRALAHYAGNVLFLRPNRPLAIQEITDGTSNTIMAGEVKAKFRPWGDPTNVRDLKLGINKSPHGFGSPSSGVAQFLYADGSVRIVNDNIAVEVLQADATPSGGEDVSDY